MRITLALKVWPEIAATPSGLGSNRNEAAAPGCEIRQSRIRFATGTKVQARGFVFLSAGHTRQCFGCTLIHLLISAAIHSQRRNDKQARQCEARLFQ